VLVHVLVCMEVAEGCQVHRPTQLDHQRCPNQINFTSPCARPPLHVLHATLSISIE